VISGWGCPVGVSVGRITGIGVWVEVLIAVGVRLSSGAVCTKGSATSIWVGVPVIGMDVGGDAELVA
jgi:hypothetical protein